MYITFAPTKPLLCQSNSMEITRLWLGSSKGMLHVHHLRTNKTSLVSVELNGDHKTVVGGKQGYAPCTLPSHQQNLSCVSRTQWRSQDCGWRQARACSMYITFAPTKPLLYQLHVHYLRTNKASLVSVELNGDHKTVVGGKQGYAPCTLPSHQQSLSCVSRTQWRSQDCGWGQARVCSVYITFAPTKPLSCQSSSMEITRLWLGASKGMLHVHHLRTNKASLVSVELNGDQKTAYKNYVKYGHSKSLGILPDLK